MTLNQFWSKGAWCLKTPTHVENFLHFRTLYSTERDHFLVLNPAKLLFNYSSFIRGQDAGQKQPSFVQFGHFNRTFSLHFHVF